MDEEFLDEFDVQLYRNKETRHVTKECWYNKEDGLLSRINGPAYQEFSSKTGQRLKAIYYIDGKIQRPEQEGPASLEWDEQGRLIKEQFYSWGQLHRSGGKPAVVEYSAETGEILNKRYYKFNKISRYRSPNASETCQTDFTP